MLLAAASAHAQIEYGMGLFNDAEGALTMQPPRVKILEDGRVLIFDEKGAHQGKIDASRVTNLKRDLAQMPLLRASRFVEFAKRGSVPHGGGISYIRFEDVIIATPGEAIDPEWTRIIKRIDAERPKELTPFRPDRLQFYVFGWPDTGNKIAWPFTSTLPLLGHGEALVSTADAAAIAFIVDHGLAFPRSPIEEYGDLYQFGIVGAAGWFDLPQLQDTLGALWRGSTSHARGAGSQDENLIEYGMGGFADGAQGPPMLFPPEVKIYGDGRIVFADKEGFWQGSIAPKRLERLKRDLANNALLHKTQLLPVTNGGVISMHGGMAYIRYRDGDDEAIVAVMSHPHRGAYPRLLNRIRQEIPQTYSRFRPKEMTFRLYPGSTWVKPVAWPFSATTPLRGRTDSITITDPTAIGFVIDHGFGGFSWMQTNVTEDGVAYEIILESAPGWFDPGILGMTLEDIRVTSR